MTDIPDWRGLGVLHRERLRISEKMSLPWARRFLNLNALITLHPATRITTIRKTDPSLNRTSSQPGDPMATRVDTGMTAEWTEGKIQWQADCYNCARPIIWLAPPVQPIVARDISAIIWKMMGQFAGKTIPASNTHVNCDLESLMFLTLLNFSSVSERYLVIMSKLNVPNL